MRLLGMFLYYHLQLSIWKTWELEPIERLLVLVSDTIFNKD